MPTGGGSFLRPALSPCIYTEFRYRKLGGKWVDRPTMPKGAVDMTDKQLQLHPDPQALVPFTFYYLEVQLMIIINNIELLLNTRSALEGGYIGIHQQ